MKKLSTFLFLALVAALLAGGIYTLRWMKMPLDPPLALDVPAAQPAALQDQSVTPTPKNNQKTCGESGSMALLVSGLSMDVWRPVHGVGAVRLVKVDFDNSAVTVLNLPRALYVTDGNLQPPQQISLTRVYLLARDAATGNNPEVINRKATQDMAQVLVDDFGYVPDHYITVDPMKFVDLVDTLNGIDIDLSAPVDGTADHLPSFPAGPQHLDGAQALALLRILHPVGESSPNVWDKFERQRVVTLGILSAMLKPVNWDQLPAVAKNARQMVVTDLSVSQVLNLLCMVKVAGESATFEDLGPGIVDQISDEQINITDQTAVEDAFQRYTSTKPPQGN